MTRRAGWTRCRSGGGIDNFVDYTRSVASFLPAGAAPTLAVLATAAELTLGVALLLGLRVRLAAIGASILLAVFGASMTASLPLAEQFYYSVFLFTAAMWTLGTLGHSPLSIDALLGRRRRSRGAVGDISVPIVRI